MGDAEEFEEIEAGGPFEAASAFPASENVPGQAASRAAYRKLFEERQKDCPWWQAYLELRHEGWDWRKAAFIAWSAMPASKRWPETQQELATKILGLRGDRVLRKWLANNPEMRARIETAMLAPLAAHLPDVIQAWVEVAKTPDPAAHKDRITYLQKMKVYTPPAKSMEITGKDGEPIAVDFDEEYRKDMAALMERFGAGAVDE